MGYMWPVDLVFTEKLLVRPGLFLKVDRFASKALKDTKIYCCPYECTFIEPTFRMRCNDICIKVLIASRAMTFARNRGTACRLHFKPPQLLGLIRLNRHPESA